MNIFINVIALLVLLLLSQTLFAMDWFVRNSHIYVSLISLLMLGMQLVILWEIYNIDLISIISFFIILCHVFNFGNFYLKLFGKEEYYIFFKDWFSGDTQGKTAAAMLTLCIIQAIFVGICMYLSKTDVAYADYKRFSGISPRKKTRMIYTVGVILFCISFPCRLYWDIKQISLGQLASGYVGGYSAVGLIDDLAVLFAPSLICIMYSKRDRKRLCTVIVILYLLYSAVIMIRSGSRRAYITSLLGMFIFYYDSFLRKKRTKTNVITCIILFVVAVIVLNFLTLIRNYRHTELTFGYLVRNINQLFSLDFVWNIFGEFGITGLPIYYAYSYFPSEIPFMCGMNLIASILYILPVGWLFTLPAATVLLNNRVWEHGLYLGTGLGSSIVCELYCDFGMLSILVALLAGYWIAKLGVNRSGKHRDVSIKEVTRYCCGIMLINFTRGSTGECVRGIASIVIAIYLLCCLLDRYRFRWNWR